MRLALLWSTVVSLKNLTFPVFACINASFMLSIKITYRDPSGTHEPGIVKNIKTPKLRQLGSPQLKMHIKMTSIIITLCFISIACIIFT